ncbi:helix-turn-helix transcriptional regulator [Streptomyces sp. H27-C3]|uniref:helix-turn-helix domain-containing protein n=1 Tax=Streptomyces sp. H27-C3 TaxID=3046305 RepID=UPI0024BA39D4|nr:helix-turn-helix transcriptional regulator [Streptomyces sp. H27-C3]MDJ0463193.1 helix-turn-helix transcriptional regulator [Streptomyces sp. H27-C3]
MRTTDLLWSNTKAASHIARRDPGGLIKMARVGLGWRQEDLGRKIGCSASTVSRLEHRGAAADLALLRTAAQAVGIPKSVLGEALGLAPPRATRVAEDGPHLAQEDPMRRRTLLAAAGLAVPAQLLVGVDDALAEMPAPSGSPTPLDARLADARALFDTGNHAKLLKVIPDLLASAQAATGTRTDISYARLSACYALASQVLVKIGKYDQARLTADRAMTFADLSGSPLTAAAAARELSIVLRHQDKPEAAQRLILNAATQVEKTGLTTQAQAAAYAQMLCTTSYTAARAGQRSQAVDMIREATRAARRLPAQAPSGRLFSITPASVSLYEVGVHWALGDAGAALHVGERLQPQQFQTAERRGRLHTDLARAWWQWGKPEQATRALLDAYRVAPAEVRDRPAIRSIVTQLNENHRQVTGVRELSHAVHQPTGASTA